MRSRMLNATLFALSLAANTPAAQHASSVWLNDSYTLEVVADDTAVPREQLLRAAEAAAATWNDNGVGPQILVVPAADGVHGGFHMDGHNTLSLVTAAWDGNPQAAALTMRSVVHGAQDAILEVDTKVNAADWSFVDGSERGSIDLQSVLTHEFGHTLGLVDDFEHEEATMFYGSKDKDTSKRDLSSEDTDAVHALYTGVKLDRGGAGCNAAGLPAAPAVTALAFFCIARRRRAARRS